MDTTTTTPTTAQNHIDFLTVEDIKIKTDKAISQLTSMPFIGVFITTNRMLAPMIQHLPKLLYIISKNPEGLEILKETKIYDYLIE